MVSLTKGDIGSNPARDHVSFIGISREQMPVNVQGVHKVRVHFKFIIFLNAHELYGHTV